MPRSDISREPTAHTEATVGVDVPDVTAEIGRDSTAHVDADVNAYGPGDAP